MIRTCCLTVLFAAFLVTAPSPASADIDRVEPPDWWVGFAHTDLQIMIHGDDVSRFDVRVDHRGVSVVDVRRGDSANYLFIYLTIDGTAEPGTFRVHLHDGDDTSGFDYVLRQREPLDARPDPFSARDVIYLITPDRFANGDPDNDSKDGYDDTLNRNDDYGRHGGDIAGITANLDYIENLGVTQLWLNPVLENAMPEASYHGYATTDLYKTDPRYGSNADYLALVNAADARGIGIIMDMIPNHIGSGHWWLDDLPTQTWLNNPESRRHTSHARTTNQDPYASAYDKAAHADGWFVDTMPDLNQRDPLLADYLIQNAIWWVETARLSGIRVDTYPYPDKDFMGEWTRRIVQEYPELNIVGEEWSPSPAIVSYWQAGKDNHDGYTSHLPSLMDFPLQIAIADALTAPEPDWGSVWTPVYESLGHDFLYPDPANLVIFADNHDMSRVFTQLGEDDALFRMAMVFYATMRGIPQIFYGTEVAMSHPGTDSHGAIRAEFPGGWPDHKASAFTGKGLTRQQQSSLDFTRRLLNWRKSADVVHHGELMQFAPVDNLYAYFRYDADETLMVVFNRGAEPATVDTARFAERLGDAIRGRDVLSGQEVALDGELTLEPRSVLLLEILN